MKFHTFLAGFVLIAVVCGLAPADDKAPATITHRITGLSCKERIDDLRELMKDKPDVKLLGIDFDHAEATFSYNSKVMSSERLGQILAEKGFGIRPASTTPPDKLTRVEISVIGLDCKGCSLGTYFVIYKLDGVEQATANFKENLVTAWIDPKKTDRQTLEKALAKAGVTLKTSP